MSSNVQSIICCLGDPVAGNPTQFLMQRAAASLAIDWMFVTAEVPESKIVEAFQGIRALRFSGVAFLPPHRSIGCKLVDSMTEAASRSGHVRVARRDGDLWLGDDSLGAAIVELLKSISSESAHPTAPPKRASIFVSGERYLSHLVRLASPPNWIERLRELVEVKIPEAHASPESSISDIVVVTSDANALMSGGSASIPVVAFEEALLSDVPVETLIVDSKAPCMTQRQLAKLRWSKSPTVVFVESNPRWESALAAAKFENLRTLRPLDVAAAKALVNFHFWTGHQTDLSSIRESLDEYCQW